MNLLMFYWASDAVIGEAPGLIVVPAMETLLVWS